MHNDWLSSIYDRKESQATYDKKNTVGFYMKLNIHTDQDIIAWLRHQSNKQGAVKNLIRASIAQEEL